MSCALFANVLLLLLSVAHTCVRTTTTTTTTTTTPRPTTTTTVPCCSLLSQSTLPRRAPLLASYEQCSILRRASSNCPADGYVFCDAAPDTNPTTMQIEFFNSTGSVVRTIQTTGTSLNARIICQAGIWVVRTSPTATTYATIAYVSCAQTGSIGADWGYVVGTATD